IASHTLAMTTLLQDYLIPAPCGRGSKGVGVKFEHPDNVPLKIPQIKAAFTLAEVLITLGIIGVVAAMTIPNLMTKIRWVVLKQQYKESYSTMNQALKLVYEKNDTIYNCYYEEYGNYWLQGPQETAQCKALYDELKTVLKVSHICENNAYQNGCIPKYRGINDIYAELNPDVEQPTFAGCAGFKTDSILKNNPAWVLADGTIIGFYQPSSLAFTKIFFMDINGSKKPNKWGYDIFAFMVMSDASGTKLYIRPGGCSYTEKGGKTGSQMLQ
ncbi:MAG: type II secretion system GspH family protein, partial [Muribaculaceae bacterium]|nr:type II secretion system GspH family protein [Muribaculaceae bacterium]